MVDEERQVAPQETEPRRVEGEVVSALEDARRLAEHGPLYYAGISRKVRRGVTEWDRWLCVFCGGEMLKGYHTEHQHEPDCPWLTLPGIVKALEALEARTLPG